MPIKSSIEVENFLIVHRCTGTLSVEDFIKAFDNVLELEDYQTGMDVIWDVRDFRIEKHFENIQQLVSHVGFKRKKRGTGYRLAAITDSTMQKMLANIFKALSSPLSFNVSVFNNEEDARAWLMENKEE